MASSLDSYLILVFIWKSDIRERLNPILNLILSPKTAENVR